MKAGNLLGCHTIGEPVNSFDYAQVLFCCKIQLEVNKVSPEGSLGAHIGELGDNTQCQVAVLSEQTENTNGAFRLFFLPPYFGQFGESKQYSYCRNQCCQCQIRALYRMSFFNTRLCNLLGCQQRKQFRGIFFR